MNAPMGRDAAMFVDRVEAGRRLAGALATYRDTAAIVVGLARGGVVVGYGVAECLNLPLRALVVRKLGAPHNPELAIGAVSETGARWLDPYLVRATGASESYIAGAVAREMAEAHRLQEMYATGPALGSIRNMTAIVVDDGIATGATAEVAVVSARDVGAARVVLAVPVASLQAVQFLRPEVDQLVVLDVPEPFYAVGLHYRNFDQVSDDEVITRLRDAKAGKEPSP